ncbi:fructose-6-phosphate aldolase [Candidatus Peregrinibacteria bacterium]|nr:MAG: fructose-6-phosphate aldolase [Candidatus Peregrinibacteria bacterium]
MKIFLDTANIADIKKYATWGIVDGVTTNPTLVAKEGVDFKTRVQEICEIIPGPVSAEVIATDAKNMILEGRNIATWAPNVFVKIPMTSDGIQAVSILSREGIRTNVTLIFSANQAMLAAKAGATLVSPFVGRLDDIGQEGMELIGDIVDIFGNYGIQTEVLAASIRTSQHILSAMKMGADIVTIPPNLLDKMAEHPLTDKGLSVFLADWKNMKKS